MLQQQSANPRYKGWEVEVAWIKPRGSVMRGKFQVELR
jgi:hypothetical protein